MIKGKKILAIIPARGGSKGIPHKNIKLIEGKPLIAWTIKAARMSRYIDKVIVSTDDTKIASVSKKYKAEVPFLRPKRLALDSSPTIEAVIHAINFLEKKDNDFDIIVLLQPTSPLRMRYDIDNAIKLLFRKKAEAIVSVTEAFIYPQWVNTLPANGCMKNFLSPQTANMNRPDLSKHFQLNGAVFVAFVDYVKKHRGFYGSKTFAYIMPKERSVDIDDILDFKFVEALLKNQNEIR